MTKPRAYWYRLDDVSAAATGVLHALHGRVTEGPIAPRPPNRATGGSFAVTLRSLAAGGHQYLVMRGQGWSQRRMQ